MSASLFGRNASSTVALGRADAGGSVFSSEGRMAMTRLRRTVLAALAVALCAAPIAAADGSNEHGSDAAVRPVHKVAGTPAGLFMGASTVEDYEESAADPPLENRCALVGQSHKALVMGPTNETTTCTVDTRTQLVIFGLGSACSDVELPPYFGEDQAAQRACAITHDQASVTELRVTVDGATVDLLTERFEVISPQLTAEVPPDSPFGLPAGPATLVAHAWMAEIRKLRPGQHTISVDAVTTDFAITSTFILNVVRG
jgi:hypothetical protein